MGQTAFKFAAMSVTSNRNEQEQTNIAKKVKKETGLTVFPLGRQSMAVVKTQHNFPDVVQCMFITALRRVGNYLLRCKNEKQS